MKLSIAYINDVHGYLELHPELFYEGTKEITRNTGGYARIAGLIKRIRSTFKDTIFFDGGDTFHGTLPLVSTKGEALLPVLNMLGLSAMVGHWDFAYGKDQLMKLLSKLDHPMLGINIYNSDGSLLLKPFIIQEVSGIKVATIGICATIIDKTMPKHFSEGLKITDGDKELSQYIKEVRAQGAEFVILLSHNGFPQDIKMLSETTGVDICLSAHTHNRLYEPVIVNGTSVIQCGCHGSFLGHLVIDLNGVRPSIQYELIEVSEDLPEDEPMKEIIEGIMQPFQPLKAEILSTSEGILHRYDTLESSMDNLLLSAMRKISNCQIAFSNGWRFAVPIPKGNITRWDLYNMLPMNPYIQTVDLKGEELLTMLEENLERTFSSDPMMQMGGYIKRCLGIRVNFRAENPKGSRIQEVYVGALKIDKDAYYSAAFITSQAVDNKLGKNHQKMSLKAVDAMANYLKDVNQVTTEKLGTFAMI